MQFPITAHLITWTWDESGNPMSIAKRLEFYVNNECVAAFEAMPLDYNYWAFGSTFYYFPALDQLRFTRRQFNFQKRTTLDDGSTRFDVSLYDLCEMIKTCSRSGSEWRIDTMIDELLQQIDHGLEPVQLQRLMAARYV